VIDPSQVQWDTPDPGSITWDDAPTVGRLESFGLGAREALNRATDAIVSPVAGALGFDEQVGQFQGKRAAQSQEANAPGVRSGWRTGGGMAADIGLTLPATIATGGSSIPVQALAQGGASALLTPGGPGDRAAAGAWGAGGAAVGAGLGRVLGGLSKSPEASRLVSQGVQPTVGQASRGTGWAGNTVARGEDLLENILPGVAGARRRAWNEYGNKVLQQVQPPAGIVGTATQRVAGQVDDATVAATRQAFGQAYDNLYGSVPRVQVTPQWLSNAIDQADNLPGPNQSWVRNMIDRQVLSRLQPGDVVDGQTAKVIRSKLSEAAMQLQKSGDFSAADAVRAMEGDFVDLLADQGPAGMRDSIRALNKSWRDFLVVERAQGAVHQGESFTPAALRSASKALDRSSNKNKFVAGTAPMAAESKAGTAVLGEKFPQSGTTPRAVAAGLMAAALGTDAMGGGGVGTGALLGATGLGKAL